MTDPHKLPDIFDPDEIGVCQRPDCLHHHEGACPDCECQAFVAAPVSAPDDIIEAAAKAMWNSQGMEPYWDELSLHHKDAARKEARAAYDVIEKSRPYCKCGDAFGGDALCINCATFERMGAESAGYRRGVEAAKECAAEVLLAQPAAPAVPHEASLLLGRVQERNLIVAAGRKFLEGWVDDGLSAFLDFLDYIERGEHVSKEKP